MKFFETCLPGCVVIEPKRLEDARGWFMESWNRDRYAEHGVGPDFVQSNLSCSKEGVLRGLHFQWPNPQGKLVSVLEGEVYDVAVDIRQGSPNQGQWAGVILTKENRRQIWIPPGFAHGFVALRGPAVVSYLCTTAYQPAFDAAIAWDDPELAIDWPVARPQVSAKDAGAPQLKHLAATHLPHYDG